MTKILTLAVPKGRILLELMPLLFKANIIPESDFFDENSRKLTFKTNLKNLQIVRVRSFDIATFVKFGVADLGICGLDVFEEFLCEETFPLLDLGIGKCRLSLAGEVDSGKNFSQINLIKIATKYPNFAKRYFDSLGIQTEIIKLSGAIEIAAKLKLCNFILDLVSTGKTLAENNMIEITKIMEISTILIANRASFKIHRPSITQIINVIDASK